MDWSYVGVLYKIAAMAILKKKEMVVTRNHLIFNYKKAPIFLKPQIIVNVVKL